ncbi:cartilage matrix protein, partial [Clarias magur]
MFIRVKDPPRAPNEPGIPPPPPSSSPINSYRHTLSMRRDVFRPEVYLYRSRSVRPSEFEQVKVFLNKIIDGLDVGPDTTRVSVVNYASRVKNEVSLKSYKTKLALVKAVSKIEPLSSGTMTGLAIQFAMNVAFSEAEGARTKSPGISKVAIIVTDGRPQDNVRDIAAKARDSGIEIYAIGVGRVDMNTLRQIASEPLDEHTDYVESYSFIEKLTQKFKEAFCGDHDCEHICISAPGSFKCACREGYTLKEDGRSCSACSDAATDVIFLIDGSKSVRPENFELVKKFIIQIVEKLDVSERNVHVGLVQYSSAVKLEFPLGKYNNKKDIKEGVRKMDYMERGTMTGQALNYMVEKGFSTSQGARAGAAKVGIVLTDGRSQDYIGDAAKKAKDLGFKMYAVGVGNAVEDELKEIASEPGNYFYTADFKAMTEIGKKLQINTCPGQEVLTDTLLSASHADNVTAVMRMHPTYLNCFLRTQNALLQPDGPLPLSWRHYIIIMASARHQCSYLVQLHRSAFLLAGGDESWLTGIHCAPQKLQRLQTLNKLLAHRPWLITQAHIQELVCPGAEPRWSLAELIQAVVLISHAHSLVSFIWGCGIHPEPDSAAEQTSPPPSSAGNESTLPPQDGRAHRHKWTEAVNEVQLLMEKMMMVQQQEEEFTQEEMVTRFERERTESLLEPAEEGRSVLPDSVSRFVRDADFIYQDFSPRGEQAPPTMRAQDYSWEDHGFSLMNRLYGEMAQLLDEKFQVVCALTYHTMAMHTDVDTSTLRKALWNYIHCIYGIRYDDYDYGEVNQLLERNMKVYIKTVACHPEKTTFRMYNNFWRQFRQSEK